VLAGWTFDRFQCYSLSKPSRPVLVARVNSQICVRLLTVKTIEVRAVFSGELSNDGSATLCQSLSGGAAMPGVQSIAADDGTAEVLVLHTKCCIKSVHHILTSEATGVMQAIQAWRAYVKEQRQTLTQIQAAGSGGQVR
jgi:hypothetical protein